MALMYLEKAMNQSQLQIYVDITGDEVFFLPKKTEDQINEYIKDMIV
jgi:glycine betaine/choline ABC-type transport system substrate-binding protein